jgi:hypothetical protein
MYYRVVHGYKYLSPTMVLRFSDPLYQSVPTVPVLQRVQPSFAAWRTGGPHMMAASAAEDAAGDGSCRHHTRRRHCFVRPLRPELRRKQFRWRKIPEHRHPNPHRHGRCTGAVGSHSAATSSSLEEASLYTLLDLYHSGGMLGFILAEYAEILLQNCRHSASVTPAHQPGRLFRLMSTSEGAV